MPLKVGYIGSKRGIACYVAEQIRDTPPGPLLDLFSGMCSVAVAVAPSRQIWCNDVQWFASTVAKAFFVSPTPPMGVDRAAAAIQAEYVVNCRELQDRFASELGEERRALQSNSLDRIEMLEHNLPNVANNASLECERVRLSEFPREAPYRLFTITFSGGYFGLEQCMQIDSLRYAIDMLYHTAKIGQHRHRWMCIALCQAANKVGTTTGHFAQYLRVKERTLTRFIAQRRRSIWYEWLRSIQGLYPIGTKSWRGQNKVFREDAHQLLKRLREGDERPAVIYADPPYTGDHYSRFYHLYETLLLYDYPPSKGVGRYRPNRFLSDFSTKTKVEGAMDALIEDCSKLGARLVLSYPRVGLLPDSQNLINSMIRKYYGEKIVMRSIDHVHSSLGASKGKEKQEVKELVFVAG